MMMRRLRTMHPQERGSSKKFLKLVSYATILDMAQKDLMVIIKAFGHKVKVPIDRNSLEKILISIKENL